jgi:Fur family ferric uptake transcriptional regulator
LICRVCGRLVDVDCAVGSAPCLTAAHDKGYEIDEAEVAYWGRCPDCLAKSRKTQRPASPSPRRRTRRRTVPPRG